MVILSHCELSFFQILLFFTARCVYNDNVQFCISDQKKYSPLWVSIIILITSLYAGKTIITLEQNLWENHNFLQTIKF